MTEAMHQNTNEDLAYMKALAEEGRNRPLMGGRYLIIWGLLVSSGLIITWISTVGVIQLTGFWNAVPWLIIGALGTFATLSLSRRESREHVTMTTAQQVEKVVWSVGGFFFLFIFVAIMALAWLGQNRLSNESYVINIMFAMIPSMAFGIYAVALAGSAIAAKAEWMWKFVVASLVFVVLSTVFIFTHWHVLITVSGVMIVITVPGILMVQKERA